MTPNTNVPEGNSQINIPKGKVNPLESEKSFHIPPKSSPFNPFLLTSSGNSSSSFISDYSLLRKPEVLVLLGISKSTLHLQINNGLIPPPIPLGERAVAFVMHEIKTVLAAKIASRSNDDIKQLVSRLVSSRQDLYEREVQACNI